MALERGFQMVEIETNAQVIKVMKDVGSSRSEIVSICQEIKELTCLSTGLIFCFIVRGLRMKHPIIMLIRLVLRGQGASILISSHPS